MTKSSLTHPRGRALIPVSGASALSRSPPSTISDSGCRRPLCLRSAAPLFPHRLRSAAPGFLSGSPAAPCPRTGVLRPLALPRVRTPCPALLSGLRGCLDRDSGVVSSKKRDGYPSPS